MDDCISNLVVAEVDENCVVQPLVNFPLSVVESNYENVGISHLVHTGLHAHSNQVIGVASNSVPANKSVELHPLEAEIQRDLELKRQQQLQLTRYQTNESVIHTIPDSSTSSLNSVAIRKPGEIIHMRPEQIQVHHIVRNSKILPVKQSSVRDQEPLSVTHLLRDSRPIKQFVVDGNKIIVFQNDAIIRQPSEIIKQEWSENTKELQEYHIESEQNHEVINESTQIPLTVQNYNQSESRSLDVQTKESGNKLKDRVETDDTDEEEDDIEPVYDHEPDPESSKSNADVNDDEEKPNKCYVCFKSFRQRKNMYAHIRKIHSTQPKILGGIVCPLCKMHALRQEHLRNHLESLHDIPIIKEERQFASMEDFLSWKDYVERETLSLYVSKSSAKLLANNQQKTYYKCHRSGNYTTNKKENRKKKLKSQGSNKIGATCPAAMEVTENIHGVQVLFWKTHVGHANDLEHLVLSKEDRARITELVTLGVPWDEILDRIKEETEKAQESPSRLSMVSKQDLRNIKKLHDMKKYPDLFPARKKVSLGRKPMKERMLRHATQELVIEKADLLLNILETTEIIAEFRPKVCLMIDNLISTVKRRAVNNIHERENRHKRRKLEMEAAQRANSEEEWTGEDDASNKSKASPKTNDCLKKKSPSSLKKSKRTESVNESDVKFEEKSDISPKKRGRPRKYNTDVTETASDSEKLATKYSIRTRENKVAN